MNISKRELVSLVDILRGFLKFFDKTSKCLQVPLRKTKIEIESTKLKNNLFARYYNDIIEHPNGQSRSSLRFVNNNSCVFPIKMFELQSNQFFFTKFVNPNHREIHHLYKNWYDVSNKCEIIESNYDV